MKVCIYRHLSLTASLTVLVLHRHGVKYYNNTSAPKNVVVAEDFLKTLPLSLYISDLDVSVLVQPLYVAYLTMEITKNIIAYWAGVKAYAIPNSLFVFASFFGVFAITTDRFLVIHLHNLR